MSEREKFMERLAKARESGLVDMKFFFRPTDSMGAEEIFAAMNEIEDAIEGGRCKKHSGWSGNEARA